MLYVIGFIGAVIVALVIGIGTDVIAQFIPKRILETILIVGGLFWLYWAVKNVIKDAIKEALSESEWTIKDVVKDAVNEAVGSKEDE